MKKSRKIKMKNKKDIILINQALNLLQQIYDNESYIGLQIEQAPWAPTLGQDYDFICPEINLIIRINDYGIHISQNNEKIYEIPISGNYVAIQEKCKSLMNISTIIETTYNTYTDGTKVKIIKFRRN